MAENDEVARPSAAYELMQERWLLPHTLWGGTLKMRAAGELYLPKQLAEDEFTYQRRIKRTFLFNAFKKTIQSMTGKVFSKEIVVEDDVPTQIEEWLEDVDLTGRHLNVFARDVFEGGAKTGLGHILVDMQRNEAQNLAQERAAGVRPYMKFIPSERLLGWRTEIVQGRPILTQIRFRDDIWIEDGNFAQKYIQRVRVIEPFAFQIWELDEDAGNWVMTDFGPMTIGVIPLATFYGQRTEFMMGEPPFEELAWLNAAHWQSSSDQRNILNVARVPILFGRGMEEGDTFTIGSNRMIESKDPNAELKFVEHSGSAISAGRDDLLDLEERMRIMGVEPLMPKAGTQTATAKAIDSAAAHSQLQAMAISLADALEDALDFMGLWANLGEDVGGSVKVNQDFGISLRDATDLQVLIQARLANEISRETLWQEMKRRNVLSDSFDADEEVERLEMQGPSLGTVGLTDEEEDEDEEEEEAA